MKHIDTSDVIDVDDTGDDGDGQTFVVGLYSVNGDKVGSLGTFHSASVANIVCAFARAALIEWFAEAEANGRDNFAEYLNGVRS